MHRDKSVEAKITQNIRGLMKEANLKPLQLANKAGLENSNFYRQLKGERGWPLKHLVKLADFFSVTVEYLIGGPLEDMKNTKLTSLPVPIPSDLAEELKCSDSFISHWNAGRKPVPKKTLIKLMEIAKRDERLAGLDIFHLLPKNIKQVLPCICERCSRLRRKPNSETIKFRAMIKKNGDWWTGWLIDLPGVNAQEKTREKMLESLKMGAEDILSAAIPFEPEAQMTTIEIPTPEWGLKKVT